MIAHVMCFNSTMVRLKVTCSVMFISSQVRCFNSTMVRLKDFSIALVGYTKILAFQFHNGSIKSQASRTSPSSLLIPQLFD